VTAAKQTWDEENALNWKNEGFTIDDMNKLYSKRAFGFGECGENENDKGTCLPICIGVRFEGHADALTYIRPSKISKNYPDTCTTECVRENYEEVWSQTYDFHDVRITTTTTTTTTILGSCLSPADPRSEVHGIYNSTENAKIMSSEDGGINFELLVSDELNATSTDTNRTTPVCPDAGVNIPPDTGCGPVCEDGFSLYGEFKCGNISYVNLLAPACIESDATVVMRKGITSEITFRMPALSYMSSSSEDISLENENDTNDTELRNQTLESMRERKDAKEKNDWESAIIDGLKKFIFTSLDLRDKVNEDSVDVERVMFGESKDSKDKEKSKKSDVNEIKTIPVTVPFGVFVDESSSLKPELLKNLFHTRIVTPAFSKVDNVATLQKFKSQIRLSNPYIKWNTISDFNITEHIEISYKWVSLTVTTTLPPADMHCKSPPAEYFKIENANYTGGGDHSNSCENRVIQSNSVFECPKDTDECPETQCEPLCLPDYKLYGKFTCTGNAQWSFAVAPSSSPESEESESNNNRKDESDSTGALPQCISQKETVIVREGVSSHFSFLIPSMGNGLTEDVWKTAIVAALPKTIAKTLTETLEIQVSESAVEMGTVVIVSRRRRRRKMMRSDGYVDGEEEEFAEDLQLSTENQRHLSDQPSVVAPFTVYTESSKTKADDIAPGFDQLKSRTALETLQTDLGEAVEKTNPSLKGAMDSASKNIQELSIAPTKVATPKFAVPTTTTSTTSSTTTSSTTTSTTRPPQTTTTMPNVSNITDDGANATNATGQTGDGNQTLGQDESTTGGDMQNQQNAGGNRGPTKTVMESSDGPSFVEVLGLIFFCLIISLLSYGVGKIIAQAVYRGEEDEQLRPGEYCVEVPPDFRKTAPME